MSVQPSPARIRPYRSLAAVILAGLLTLVAPAAAAFAAAPSDQDSKYLTANMQTSLAEITIGNLALQKSQDAGVIDLANMTLTDHTAALAKATTLAQTLGIPVPTEPSEAQKADAAKLSAASGDDFNVLYAQVQVAGHNTSVASTNTEISSGTDPAAVQYATEYLPVATMHLEMAQDLTTALGAAPTAVPAGDGGMAAHGGLSTTAVLMIVLGVLVLVGGAYLLVRSSRRSSTD